MKKRVKNTDKLVLMRRYKLPKIYQELVSQKEDFTWEFETSQASKRVYCFFEFMFNVFQHQGLYSRSTYWYDAMPGLRKLLSREVYPENGR